MKIDLKELIASLKRNDNACLKVMFEEYSDQCTKRLIKKTDCTEEDAEDIFVDSILNFRERLLTGKIEYLTNIGGYLYSTCYKMWLVKYRKSKIHESHAEDIRLYYNDTNLSGLEKEKLHETANRAISSLGDKCQTIIKLFYLNKLNMKEIADEMGFASAGVAKTLKSRCYKKLIEEAKKQLTMNQISL